MNLVAAVGIARVFRRMRTGEYDEAELERHLHNRGFLARLLGRVTRRVSKPWHLYPVGLLMGLGFDTATQVALLVLAAGSAAFVLPWYAILVLPVLFAAGMSLFDTADGVLMSRAYGWAFLKPVRKVFYNLTVTLLSVTVALVIGAAGAHRPGRRPARRRVRPAGLDRLAGPRVRRLRHRRPVRASPGPSRWRCGGSAASRSAGRPSELLVLPADQAPRRTPAARTARGRRRPPPARSASPGCRAPAAPETTMPPFAVPSSLVRTTPVTSTASVNTRAWTTPFWPVVASRTSSTSVTGACFSTTRLILPSSSIRPDLVCSRPAVSIDDGVDLAPRRRCATASKATDAGSPPSRPRTVRTPTRSPQVSSWSAAAARKVSAAPRTTLLPSPTSTRAILPTVVVLPAPLTPTTRTTPGSPSCRSVPSVRSRSGPRTAVSSPTSSSRSSRARRGGQHHRLGAQPLDDLGGRGDADVGGQEGLLDLLPVVLGELLAREDGEQAAAEGGLRAGQPRAQPHQPAGRRRRRLEDQPRLGLGRRQLDRRGGASGTDARPAARPAVRPGAPRLRAGGAG